jgi:hypothetical protein
MVLIGRNLLGQIFCEALGRQGQLCFGATALFAVVCSL